MLRSCNKCYFLLFYVTKRLSNYWKWLNCADEFIFEKNRKYDIDESDIDESDIDELDINEKNNIINDKLEENTVDYKEIDKLLYL